MNSKWVFLLCILANICLNIQEVLSDDLNITEEYYHNGVSDERVSEIPINRTEYYSKPTDDSLISYINESRYANQTINSTDMNNSTQVKVVSCLPNMGGDYVEIVNNTRILQLLTPNSNVTSKDTPSNCTVIFFYMKWCPFSSAAARHFNALPRIFPDLKMVALDVMTYQMFNAQYGIVGVPTVLLMHNGKPAAKFNETEYRIDLFAKFVTKHTGIESTEKLYVTSEDFRGPLSSTPEYQTDYCLGLSWLFITVCGVYFFTKSKWWTLIIETIQNTWRESEAQHEHAD